MPTSAPRSESSAAPAPPSCQGTHLICELYEVSSRLTDEEYVADALEAAARACGATHLETRLHPFEENGGVTGAVLLAESHITIHTWPEHSYAAVDVFLCGDCDPEAALPVLEEAFGPETMEHRVMERGRIADGS